MKDKTTRLKKIFGAARRAATFCARHAGINLVCLGVLLYAVFYFTGLTNHNVLLYLPLLIIIIGTVGFVRRKKTEGRY